MKRAVFILVSFGGILFPAYLYLALRLTDSMLLRAILAVPFLLIAAFPLTFRTRDEKSIVQLGLTHLGFVSMGLLTYLLVGTLLRDGILLVTGELIPGAAVVGGALLAVALGTLRAYLGPQIVREEFFFEGVSKGINGLRIVHISDLHIGTTIKKSYVERMVRLANSLEPDIIAFTGDIGDGRVSDLQEEISSLSQLRAKHGMFYVPGNHEYYWSVADWIRVMESAGATVLLNQGQMIDLKGAHIWMAGVPDTAAPQMSRHPRPDARVAMQGGQDAAFKVLLSHRPDLAEQASEVGFDLQLSGHTHGGQFFPWTIVVRFVHRFFLGRHRLGKMWIYVSGGTGSWGPLLRLGTIPEITLLQIRA